MDLDPLLFQVRSPLHDYTKSYLIFLYRQSCEFCKAKRGSVTTGLPPLTSRYYIFVVNMQTKQTPQTVFLIAAIMQSHDCAKYLIICANFVPMNKKQEILALIMYLSKFDTVLSSSFTSFDVNLPHVSAQYFQLEAFDCAK